MKISSFFITLAFISFLTACVTATNYAANEYIKGGCEISTPEGTDNISYYSRKDRKDDRYLKARAQMYLTKASCKESGGIIHVQANIDIGYELGKLGRINQNDLALFSFPYAIIIVEGDDKIIAEDVMDASARFEAHQVSARTSEIIKKDFRISGVQQGRAFSVYLGFLQPRGSKTFHISPPVNKLIPKPKMS